METEPPASMPKPFWSNKTPTAKRPEAEPEEAPPLDELPAVQLAHAPEQAAEARPAWSPKVPAGQSEQAAAPASE